jgi:hypothetical protein
MFPNQCKKFSVEFQKYYEKPPIIIHTTSWYHVRVDGKIEWMVKIGEGRVV